MNDKSAFASIRITLFSFSLVILTLTGCQDKKVWHKADLSSESYRVDKKITDEDASVIEMIAPYKIQLDAKMGETLVKNEQELFKQKPNSLLGNWMADAIVRQTKKYYKGQVDFGIQNYGGIRVRSLAEGELTLGQIYELMPFDNMMVIVKADGKATKALFERIADYGGWPISKELHLDISNNTFGSALIGDKAFDQNKTYHIVMPDYIANGGDKCDFLKDLPREETGVLIRTALIDDLKEMKKLGNTLAPDASKRIRL